VARKFLAELLAHKQVRALLSDEHFSVDGTQVAAWASMKSRLVLSLSSAARDIVRLGLDHPSHAQQLRRGRDLPNSSGSRSPRPTALA
jgi:hypothetical protein